MASNLEQLSARFQRWEQRTRGWQVHPQAVAPEPAFAFFKIPDPLTQPIIDDAKRPTALSSMLRSLWRAPLPTAPIPEAEEEPQPAPFEREVVMEFPLFLRDTFHPKSPDYAPFLNSLAHAAAPMAFELIGTPQHVTAQLAASETDALHLQQQLRAIFPEAVCVPAYGNLQTAWHAAEGGDTVVVEFGLARESLLPLAGISHDLCVPLIGALSELEEGEFSLFQVLFERVKKPWAESLVDAVSNDSGKAYFINAPELLDGATLKTARPLFGAVVRIAVRSPDFARVSQIARNLASALSAFSQPNGNSLIPLHNDHYSNETHVEDVLRRQTHRSGMLLNADELLGLIRFPTSAVRSPKFQRLTRKTKPAPAIATGNLGITLGLNTHAGETQTVRLTPQQRVQHTHIIGASGTGKSTLFFNLIRQDIENGQGVGILDPHGDLIEKILGIIPDHRINDVVLLDPADEEFIVGFNILSAHSDWEKNLLASDLVSVFRRLSTGWGDQMGSVLGNAVRAFLESEHGGTLADMRRFFLEPAFREQFLETVRDQDVVYYWRKGFPQLGGNKSIGPILTRLETFLGPKPIRYMVSQTDNRLDFGGIMDGGKIFLAKLSQGAIGNENAYLLGSLLVTKIHQLAISRQRQQESARRDFWLYLDEFQNFITPSMAEILSGARKYRIGLTLAHQELRQLQRDSDVASAVLTNAYTRVCFRVGDQDARVLDSNFSAFEASDLQNLANFEAVCRVERSDFDFNLSITRPDYPSDAAAASRRHEVMATSREKYSTARAEVEAALSVSRPSALPAASTTARDEKRSKAVVPPTVPAEATEKSSQTVAPSKPIKFESTLSRVREEKLDSPAADLGRGGIQHKAIQSRIKEAAEALGFRVMVEKKILDGAGQVDLLLERDGASVACEITVTNTIDNEVGNVSKCVNAGFLQIALIGTSQDKLAKLQGAVTHSLGPDVAARVSYYLPDEFMAALKNLPPPAPPSPTEKRVRGWTSKAKRTVLSPEETKAREDAMIQLLAENMTKENRPPKNP
jgi:hypothetical protein